MAFIFTLVVIMAVAFVAATIALPFTRSPLWDAVLIYSLYVFGFATLVLGAVGTVGLLTGLL